MKKLLLVLLIIPFFLSGAEVINLTDVKSCLRYDGYVRNGLGFTLQFKNTCYQDVFAMACATYPNGKREINKSSSRIPKWGRWNISFFEGDRPVAVDWSASLSSQVKMPQSCS